jgi:hypothetical protein
MPDVFYKRYRDGQKQGSFSAKQDDITLELVHPHIQPSEEKALAGRCFVP